MKLIMSFLRKQKKKDEHMKIPIGEIIQFGTENSIEKEIRVLFIDASFEDVAVIDLRDKTALPEFIKYKDLCSDIKQGIAKPSEKDKFAAPFISEEILSQNNYKSLKERRDKAVAIIRPLVTGDNEIKILFDKSRTKLVNEVVILKGVSRQTIYTLLRKYWKGGMTFNALIPNFQNCGARGSNRKYIGKKPGAKSLITQEKDIVTGVVMNDEWVEKITLGGRIFYENIPNSTFREAYRKTLERFCSKKDKETGQLILPDPNKGEVFSFTQFCYQYKKIIKKNLRKVLTKIHGKRNFDVLFSDRSGTFRESIYGPGTLYQIDATEADVSLVSFLDSENIIGRPTVFAVIDSFSIMVVGIAIRINSEDWLGYREALINVVEDKVTFCAEFGIELQPEEWINTDLPQQLLADRGAMEGVLADSLVYGLGVQLSNTAPYRPDWKGYVEQIFNLMNKKGIHKLPGSVPQNPQFGEKDYRFDSSLTIHDFKQIVIQIVRNYNNHHRMENFEMDLEMIQDKVEPYPRDIYLWGLENRSFPIRRHSLKEVEVQLFKTEESTVTEHGIRFRNLYYSCKIANEEDWRLQAKNNGDWKLKIAYHPRKIEPVYIRKTDGSEPVECFLIDRSSPFLRCDWKEVEQYFKGKKVSKKLAERRGLQSDSDLMREINKITQAANKRKKENLKNAPSQTNSSKLKQISKNKNDEIRYQNELEKMSENESNLKESLNYIVDDSTMKHIKPQQPINLQELRKESLKKERKNEKSKRQ
jgi:putative transposase